MKNFQKAIAGFLLCIGLAVIGLTVFDLFNATKTKAEKQRATAALIIFGFVPAGVGGYLLWAMADNAHRQEQGRLRAAFFRLVRAGQGRITALDFATEATLSVDVAQTYLDERAEHFGATRQIDDEGTALYGFQVGYADTQRLLDDVDDALPKYSLLLKTIPSEREDDILKVLQELMKVEPEAIKEVWKEPLLPVQIGMTQAIAQDYRKRLEDVGAVVLVVLE